MKRSLLLGVGMSAILASTALPVAAAQPRADGNGWKRIDVSKVDPRLAKELREQVQARLDKTVTVIVKLAGDPVAVHTGRSLEATGRDISADQKAAIRSRLASQQRAVEAQVRLLGGTVRQKFDTVYNGLVVRTKASRIEKLAALPGVAKVSATRIVRPTNHRSVPYIGAPSAWASYNGVTGKGVRIAVIDTGIDYTHRNFNGAGKAAYDANHEKVIEPGTFPTGKVVAGYDLVGDEYDASSDDPAINQPDPDPDPLDCNGHGSHVAGSAAGFGVRGTGATYLGPWNTTTHGTNFRIGPGVAPEAKLIAVRVFGCAGSADTAVIVEAIERSVELGAHVINMSLGSDIGLRDDPDSEAADAASQGGVTVAVSAGNAGHNPFVVGGPGVADRVIATAAMDTIPSFPVTDITLQSPAATVRALIANGDTDDLPMSGTLNYFVDNPATPTDPNTGEGGEHLGCTQSAYTFNNFVAGQISVTTRGVCPRVDRATLTQQNGGKAAIMVNTSDDYPPFEGTIPGVTIPFLGVPSSAADELAGNDGDTANLSAAIAQPNPGYRKNADFTSGGPRRLDNALKPDVTAPGVGIVSTLVGSGNQGVGISGTSMASPHTAGLAALVKQKNPAWSPSRIKGAIVGTATASASKLADYDTRLNGSGLIDARKAIDTYAFVTTLAGQSSLSFGYAPSEAGIDITRVATFWNTGPTPITYNLTRALNGNSYGASVTVSPATLTVPAQGANGAGHATASVRIRLTAAQVRALPGAGATSFDPAAIVTVKGALVATPSTSAARRYQLRVPFLMVPRGLSDIAPSQKSAYTQSNGIASTSVRLTNYGGHAGNADVYAWGLTDGRDTFSETDIRAVGVQALPGTILGGASTDRALIWAVNHHDRYSTASQNAIFVDVNTRSCIATDGPSCQNSDAEYSVLGVDLGLFLAGSTSGQYAAFTIDNISGALTDAYYADAPVNGSTVLLPTLASSLGLKQGAAEFGYSVFAFCVYCESDFAIDVVTTSRSDQPQARFAAFRPPVSQGDYFELQPGASATLPLTVDRYSYARNLTKGWMIVTIDDRNGERQADTIYAEPLP